MLGDVPVDAMCVGTQQAWGAALGISMEAPSPTLVGTASIHSPVQACSHTQAAPRSRLMSSSSPVAVLAASPGRPRRRAAAVAQGRCGPERSPWPPLRRVTVGVGVGKLPAGGGNLQRRQRWRLVVRGVPDGTGVAAVGAVGPATPGGGRSWRRRGEQARPARRRPRPDSGTPPGGHDGGLGNDGTAPVANRRGGGGGGAGAPGTDGRNGVAPHGGAGVSCDYSGTPTYYGRRWWGGASQAPLLANGGKSAAAVLAAAGEPSPVAATPNTGGGGGGIYAHSRHSPAMADQASSSSGGDRYLRWRTHERPQRVRRRRPRGRLRRHRLTASTSWPTSPTGWWWLRERVEAGATMRDHIERLAVDLSTLRGQL